MNTRTKKSIKGLSQKAMRLFMDYPWPGNVRELENAIEHAFVLCNYGQITPADLPREIRHLDSSGTFQQPYHVPAGAPAKRNKMSKSALLELLDQCEWNKAEVARRVGLSRTSIWQYMKKWDIPLKQEA